MVGVPQHVQDDLDLDGLLAIPEFRRFCLRLFEQLGMLQTTHVASAPTQSAFAEGRRSTALTILDMLTARQPDALIRVLSESKPATPQEQQNGRRRHESPSDDD